MGRYKLNIQSMGDGRVLLHNSLGLSERYINAVNQLAKKERWLDVAFATLDDNKIALVCKPSTGAKIISWNRKVNKIKYPDNFEKVFLRKCNEALYKDDLIEYTESLNRDEEELKKYIVEAVHEVRDKKKENGEDKTWEAEV